MANARAAALAAAELRYGDLLIKNLTDDFGNHGGAINSRSADFDRPILLLQELDLIKDEFTASLSGGHAVNPQVITRSEGKAA